MSNRNGRVSVCVCVCVCLWQSEIFYAENTIHTRHVIGNLKKRQAAFEREILKLSQHSFVISSACAGWNILTFRKLFISVFK